METMEVGAIWGVFSMIVFVAAAVVVAAARCGEVVSSDLVRDAAHNAIDNPGGL